MLSPLRSSDEISFSCHLQNALNRLPESPPALVAFAIYQSIETLTREILTDLADRIKVYENGNISAHFKFADEFRRIAEYIDINTTDTAKAGCAVLWYYARLCPGLWCCALYPYCALCMLNI